MLTVSFRYLKYWLRVVGLLLVLTPYSAQGQWNLHLLDRQAGSGELSAMATDSVGNMFLTGFFSGVVTTPKGTFTAAGAEDMFVAKYDTLGTMIWFLPLGGQYKDVPQAIATDGSGNCYITGLSGGGFLVANQLLTRNALIVVKIDTTGRPVWVNEDVFGESPRSQGISIAADRIGRTVVTGFAPATGISDAQSLVARIDRFGKTDWRNTLPANSDRLLGNDTGIMSNIGSIVIGGSFAGELISGADTLSATGAGDAVLIRYTAEGEPRWSRKFGGTGNDFIQGIFIDPAQDIYFTGGYQYQMSLGTNLVSRGQSDVFVGRMDSTGKVVWGVSMGGSGNDTGTDVVVDERNNTYVLGYFEGTAHFGDITLVAEGGQEPFLAKVGTDGYVYWAIRFGWLLRTGSTSNDLPDDLADWADFVRFVQQPDASVLINGWTGEWQSDYTSVDFSWNTQVELDSDVFQVRRSTDGITWETISTQDAAGISLDLRSYWFTDDQLPATALLYYQLAALSITGEATLSQVLTFERSSTPRLLVYPNPVQTDLNVRLYGLPRVALQVQLLDHTGKSYYLHPSFDPATPLQIDVSRLAAGLYYLWIKDSTGRITLSQSVAKY
ncbi:MAG: SBBP repeat-containing protein [Bacteroidia bacterium]|nr:SBBP repeat-containing protein [Bacteroidia bacterium]